MKTLILERDPFNGAVTTGLLKLGDLALHTIERPWFPIAPGGQPFASCVPGGRYELIPHTRPNGDDVFAMINKGLGVFYLDQDRKNSIGRYLCLIHAGNRVSDVSGCIAPGLGASSNDAGPIVTSSRAAMKCVREFIGDGPAELYIEDWREWR